MTVLGAATLIVGFLFLLGSLDDLLIDLVYELRGLKPRRLSEEDVERIRSAPEKAIAVLIPAWQESAVLEAMVKTNLGRLEYTNYRWYIGVYPNDPATLAIAHTLEARHPELVKVVVTDRPGPTSKAHCLNCVLQVLSAQVQQARHEGEGWIPEYAVIHDAEDVIDPLAFKVVSSEHPSLDFIQVPIFSLPVPTTNWVAGTYMDEFAEIHVKELPVRQSLQMPIPSAGVGTFFSWSILEKMTQRFGGAFDEANLTEDYEISLRIARLGGTQKFLLIAYPDGRILATREYFPDTLGRSIRQKTRWTTGIAFQTFRKWGFFGSLGQPAANLPLIYALWRDRKSLWSNPASFAGWALAAVFSAASISNRLHPATLGIPTRVLNILFTVNAALFGIRLLQRARFTGVVYTRAHALLAIPRSVVSNVINGMASLRAARTFLAANGAGNQPRTIEWDKTEHKFPELEALEDALAPVTRPGLKTAHRHAHAQTARPDTSERTRPMNAALTHPPRAKGNPHGNLHLHLLLIGLLGAGAASQASALDVKAFSLTATTEHPYKANPEGQPKTSAQLAVDAMKDLGANAVFLTPVAVMESETGTTLVPQLYTRTLSEERRGYTSLINYIHSRGMAVGLRPILLVRINGQVDPQIWHGNIKPSDPLAWFDSLRAYLDIYLPIASATGVENFTVGAELYSMTVGLEDQWPEHPFGFPREWTGLIRDIKARLGNQTTVMLDINYTDATVNADGTGPSGGEMERWRYRLVDLKPNPRRPITMTPENAAAWEQLKELWTSIDLIGIDNYRSLTPAGTRVPEAYEALTRLLQQGTDKHADDIDNKLYDIELALGAPKGVIIKEVGFKSCERCFINPFEYDAARPVNLMHQAASYQAFFNSFVGTLREWLKGVVFWDYATDPARAGTEDPGFSPRGKPLTEEVIRRGWGT